jgi:glutaredoxin 3
MDKKISVYSTQTCPYCRMVKDYLKEKGVKFEEIDVSQDSAKAKEMIEKSGQMGVPQIEIGDKMIVGFDKDSIDEALK